MSGRNGVLMTKKQLLKHGLFWTGSAIAILIWAVVNGCAALDYYQQNCVDRASNAAHTYEHHVRQPAVVCIGRVSVNSKGRHAQAMGIYGEWLGVFDGRLYLHAPKELGEIYWCKPVRDFDNTRWNVKR